jgi:hypothetical protein
MVVSHGTMALSALFWALETLDKPESPQPIEDGSPPDDP